VQFTGAPLDTVVRDRLATANGAAVRPLAEDSRRAHRSRRWARAGHRAHGDRALCQDANVAVDPKLDKMVGALGEGIVRVEYGRAGERAGVDVYLEPSEAGAEASSRSAAERSELVPRADYLLASDDAADRAMRGRSVSRLGSGWSASQQDRERGAVAASAERRVRDRRGQPLASGEQDARGAAAAVGDRTHGARARDRESGSRDDSRNDLPRSSLLAPRRSVRRRG